jgi:hypothetical protein
MENHVFMKAKTKVIFSKIAFIVINKIYCNKIN